VGGDREGQEVMIDVGGGQVVVCVGKKGWGGSVGGGWGGRWGGGGWTWGGSWGPGGRRQRAVGLGKKGWDWYGGGGKGRGLLECRGGGRIGKVVMLRLGRLSEG